MMKFHAALTTGLATFFVAPAALSSDELQTLEAALQSTSRALDVVVGVERSIQADPEGGAELIKQVTEAPVLDARRRDERLAALRGEVSLLRAELDQLELNAIQSGVQPLDEALAEARSNQRGERRSNPQVSGGGSSSRAPVSTGLDEATRSALSQAKAEAMARAEGRTPVFEGSQDAEATERRTREYSADPLRHARTCYRAGRYEEGHALLANAEGVEALFWRARCSERMDDLDAAKKDLQQVLAMDPNGPFSVRAQQDLDFVEWKRAFLERMGDDR